VQTDEAEDVAASIRHFLRCRQLTSADTQAWKWVALSLHSALQGACVCHLETTASPIGVVTKENACEWMKYFEASRADPKAPAPKTKLLSLPDLLKAARKPKSAGDGSSPGIQLSDRELEWLKRFHDEVRNQFVHFAPTGWLLDVSGIPSLGKLVARIIQEILNAGWAFRHKDEAWQTALRNDLLQLSSG
jgi:hypothetical protein